MENYKELPESKEHIRERLLKLLGRTPWVVGTWFNSEIKLQERKVSRSLERHEAERESTLVEIVTEAREKHIPMDYDVEIILRDEPDNDGNVGRDWLFFFVRFVQTKR